MRPSCSSLKRITCSSARRIISILRNMPNCFSREGSGNIFPPKIISDRTIKSHARWTNGIYCVMGGVVKGKSDYGVQGSKFNVQGPKTNRNVESGTLNLEHRCVLILQAHLTTDTAWYLSSRDE